MVGMKEHTLQRPTKVIYIPLSGKKYFKWARDGLWVSSSLLQGGHRFTSIAMPWKYLKIMWHEIISALYGPPGSVRDKPFGGGLVTQLFFTMILDGITCVHHQCSRFDEKSYDTLRGYSHEVCLLSLLIQKPIQKVWSQLGYQCCQSVLNKNHEWVVTPTSLQ